MPLNFPDYSQYFQQAGQGPQGNAWGGLNVGPQRDWMQQNAWANSMDPYNWQQGAFDPENPFGQTMVNAQGESFQITPELIARQQWGEQALNDQLLSQHGWVSPGSFKGVNIGNESFFSRDSQGNLVFNPGAMSGMMDQFGLGSSSAPGGYGFTAYSGDYDYTPDQVSGPEGHEVESFQQSLIDVTDLINAEAQLSDQRRADAWADAAARFGQSGAVASTPYMEHLGNIAAEEEARKDQIFGQYRMATGMDYAQRQLQEAMQRRDLEADVWGQQQAMAMQAALANQQANLQNAQFGSGQDFQAWLAQNQMGMDDYWNQQDYKLQYDLMNQQVGGDLMAQMMMGMMGYV